MADSKIKVQLGGFSFSGEGDSEWLSSQLEKILDRAEELLALMPSTSAIHNPNVNPAAHQPADLSNQPAISTKTLVSFLKDKNATTNQVDKFLATATWLEARGSKRVTTKEVGEALKVAAQKRLTNASDTLARNVGKGFCEKDGSSFFVTQEGKEHLGISEF